MRGATRVSLQLQQVLRLPGKMTLVINPLHTWNAIYNARSNKSQPPTSASTAPARKNDSRDQSSSHMKRYLQCAEEQVSLSKLTKYCACHEKWISWLILVTHETLFTMRGATRVLVQTHQILRLPRKMNLMLDPCHAWNAIYNARRNTCHCPNSPYCACHEKWNSWLILVTHETLFTMRGATSAIVQTHQILRLPRKMMQNDSPKFCKNFSKTAETSFPMRGRSENDPSRIREWSENETVTPQPASQARLLFALATSIFYWKIQHFALRLSFQISPNTAPATKSDSSTSPNTAPATKSDTWTSPNSAPATQNDCHDWSLSRMKRYLQCAEQQMASSNLMLDPCHTWNAIYNARRNKCHCPNSPNTAPATKNESHDWSLSHM